MWQGERPDVLASLQTNSWTGTHWERRGTVDCACQQSCRARPSAGCIFLR